MGFLPRRIQTWLVLAAMAGFTAWFAAYGIRLHQAHLTAKSDLGQMDLAIWNTSRGRPLQEIKGETISTRLTDHVELIFLPVSTVFWLWDDVRALLLLQAAALAAGAWPLYFLARRWVGRALSPPDGAPDVAGRWADLAAWAGLAFAIAYLLHPALQAAAVSEFHALPLAPPLIAWALWAVEQRQWGRFLLAAFLLAHVQEGMALLAALLGLYAVFRAWRAGGVDTRQGAIAGTGAFLFGVVWFAIATFMIIPHYAAAAYGLSETPYVARYGALGDSFADVLVALVTRPGDALKVALEPLRLRYVFGLLAPTAFLALLAPDILLLSAPLFLANLLSSYPLQYAGELHYSAPLVPYIIAAGALGASRLLRQWRRSNPGAEASTPVALLSGAVLLCTLAWQVVAGYTPIGGEFRQLVAGGLPQATEHERLLSRFGAQIPPQAPLSVTADLYPHLSHRELIYKLPWLGQAEWVLADVTGRTDVHPAELQERLGGLLGEGWGVVDAADGYVLLGKGRGESAMPEAFYDFTRVAATEPEYALDVTFGGRVRLLGYDLVHDLKWRTTYMRMYWQALEPLPEDAKVEMQMLTPSGQVADDSAVRPAPALIWYPPPRWQPGETLAVTTLPWYLPVEWAPAVRVHAGGEALIPQLGPDEPAPASDGWLRLPGHAWQNGRPEPYDAPDNVHPAAVRFTAEDWPVELTGYAMPHKVAPGRALPVKLRWVAGGPAARNYTVFVHMRDADGKTVATGDGTPTWFTQRPADRWPVTGFSGWDAHELAVPAELPAGDYQVVVGWYDLETGQRLPVEAGTGNSGGDEHVLGSVRIDPDAAPRADLCCATAPECCASLE